MRAGSCHGGRRGIVAEDGVHSRSVGLRPMPLLGLVVVGPRSSRRGLHEGESERWEAVEIKNEGHVEVNAYIERGVILHT